MSSSGPLIHDLESIIQKTVVFVACKFSKKKHIECCIFRKLSASSKHTKNTNHMQNSQSSLIKRVLDEVKNAESNAANTTAHGVYVSGVFEENNVLNRVLDEVKNAESNAANTTAHGVYVSGVFEENNVLNRVLDEVKNAESNAANTTAHGVYVSGVFEETSNSSPVPESIDLVQAVLFPALALCAADGVTSDAELDFIQKEIVSKAEFYGLEKKELEENMQGVVDWIFHHSNNTALILNEAILCCERCAEYWNESKDFQKGYFKTLEGIAAADGITDHIEKSWLNDYKKALGL